MPDHTKVKVGDKITMEMGYSEVCIHLGVAGRVMVVEVKTHGAQLWTVDGEKFSFSIAHGEAGLYASSQIGASVVEWEVPTEKVLKLETCDHSVTVSGRCLKCHPDLQDQVDGGV